MIPRLSVVALAAFLTLQPAIAGKRRPPPDVVDDALAYVITDRTKAVRLLEDAIEHREVRKPDMAVVMVHAGEQRRLMADVEQAREWFATAQTKGKDWEIEAARLGLALLDATSEPSPDTWLVLETVRDKEAIPTQNADRYLLLAMRAAQMHDTPRLKEYTRKALSAAREDAEVEERVRGRLEALAEQPDPEPSEVEPIVEIPTLEVMSDMEKAERALQDGDRPELRRLVEQILADEPEPAEQLEAEYLLKRVDAVQVAPHRVAVLLPLSGKYEAAGKQVQDALVFGHRAAGGAGTFEFVDSGSTPETAVAALEKAVLEDGAVAVVGPLLSDEAESVAAAAQALHVPLISLSQGLDVDSEQDWVFQAMVTLRDQIEALVEFTMTKREMTAFAVFAPDNNYGHRSTELFTATVEARGGEVTATEFYDPAATDLVPFAKTLGRKDYEERAWEYRKLKAEAREKGGNPDRVVLPPTLDFQGLFLPDKHGRVPIACAALAYEEFPIGEFQTTRRGTTIPLLGLSGWNNGALVAAGGPYVRSSIFTDSFFADDDAGKEFVTAFQADAGRTPGPLEAVAVDAGRLIALAADTGPADRDDFREALLGLAVEETITGAAGFDPEERRAQRHIRVLTITKTDIRALDLEPPTEEDPATTGSGG